MCDLCLHFPHLPGCPNAPEPIPFLNCEICGQGIFEEDKYYDSLKGPLCEDCLDNMTALDFLEFEGESLQEAEENHEEAELKWGY